MEAGGPLRFRKSITETCERDRPGGGGWRWCGCVGEEDCDNDRGKANDQIMKSKLVSLESKFMDPSR